MEDFADTYLRGETPVPCVALQPDREVPRPARDRARARRRGAGDRPLCAPRGGRGGPRAASRRRSGDATRAISSSRTTPSSSTSCAFRSAHCRRARRARSPTRFDLPVAEKPDSQDICFVPNGDYASRRRKLRPGGAVAPGEIVDMAGEVRRPPRRHRALHRRPAPRPGARRACRHRQRSALCRAARARDSPRRRRPPERARPKRDRALRCELDRAGLRRTATGSGEGALEPGAAAGQVARSGNSVVVRFAEPELGVSPGQACVMYDGASGSRVLGGGFIRRF